MQYMTFWVLCICSWISNKNFIIRQPKYLNGLTDLFIGTVLQGFLAIGEGEKRQKMNLTNHRALYHVKCIVVILWLYLSWSLIYEN